MPTQTLYDVRVLSRIAAGPILGSVNKFVTPVMPIAWAFEQSQRNFSILFSLAGVIVSLVYAQRGPGRKKAGTVSLLSIFAGIILAILYLGFLEQINPNPTQLPLTRSTLGPSLTILYATPFFFVSLGLSMLGLSGTLPLDDH